MGKKNLMVYYSATMSDHWLLAPSSTHGHQLALSDMGGLLEQLGRPNSHAVAEALLRLLGRQVPLAQCTIFTLRGQGRPQLLGLGDRARTHGLALISDDYVNRFYLLDGSQRLMQTEPTSASAACIFLHRQRSTDVQHPEYRAVCYELPRLVERLSILQAQQGGRWLSVNLYRGEEHGPFDASAIATMEAYAPLIMQAMRLHYAGQTLQDDLAGLVLTRLQQRCPALTVRDLDVLRALLQGLSTEALAERLGLTLESARTYLKRLYRKLGVAGQRELFALLLAPVG